MLSLDWILSHADIYIYAVWTEIFGSVPATRSLELPPKNDKSLRLAADWQSVQQGGKERKTASLVKVLFLMQWSTGEPTPPTPLY